MKTIVFACVAVIAWPALGRAEPEPEPGMAARASAGRPASEHRWLYLRLGGALVKPLSSSRELELAEIDGPASLAVQNGPIAGSGATVGSPFTVKFEATGTLANMSIAPSALGIPTGVGALGPTLGEAQAVPPVVTVVYQLTGGGRLRPYAGAGASVLFARNAHVTNPTLLAAGKPEMSIAPAPGLVLQGGLDVQLWRRVYARVDVKFIALMLARAEVKHIQVETPGLPLFDSVEVGTAKMDVWVNPLIVQAGVGYDF
jgi:outer membrane protein W